MIRVAEHVARTHTGHQRATNEDSHLERAPVFVVADGMGGAQAGEVASRVAIGHFADGLPGEESDGAEHRLAQAVRAANSEIHALSEADARRAGMGTTLTAAYVGRGQVSLAHVGDSRAYRLRGGELERLTEDHSLVEELLRQGRLTEAEAEDHPQRSIITRALGPEPDVEVDTQTLAAQDGDVYLLCSDGLTSMVSDGTVGEILRSSEDLAAVARKLVRAALDAGGRDNVTVVLFRVEEVAGVEERPTEAHQTLAEAPEAAEEDTAADGAVPAQEPAVAAEEPTLPAEESAAPAGPTLPAEEPAVPAEARVAPAAPAAEEGSRLMLPRPGGRRERADSERVPRRLARVNRRAPRIPRGGGRPRRSRLRRRLVVSGSLLAVLAAVVIGGVLAGQAVYFIGTDRNGQVTVFNGLPWTLPGGLRLYTEYFVSGVTVAELSGLERHRLFNNQLRSQAQATRLVSQLELGQIAGQ